ncbi:MAG: PAP/fibrillin family protein [Prochlorococcaceae cyanobacterium]|jgi:hypothetical protein
MQDELVQLLQGSRPATAAVLPLIEQLETLSPCDLNLPLDRQRLTGVWELRWSSGRQPYLQPQPWLENLQVLRPSVGAGLNLLRGRGPLAAFGGVAVEAALTLEAPRRVQVRFRRGGWIGPAIGPLQARLLTAVQQSFPAWLDITVLTDQLRLCRGNTGTVFALLRRQDLDPADLLPDPGETTPAP